MKLRTLSLALFASAIATQSFAHATFEVKEAVAASYYKAVVRIGHGCDGQSTQKVRVTIPEGIISVKPMPKAGWELTATKGDYANTYELHNSEVKSGVTQIEWTGELKDGFYDEFVFQAYLTDKLPKDKSVYIPVVQECADSQVGWTEIPAEGQNAHDLDHPAPGIMISSAKKGHGASHKASHKASHGAAAMPMIKVGELEIKAPTARATVPNAPVAGGYLTIHNTGSKADRLIGGSASFASKVEVHEMAMENDVMKMRQLNDGLEIPAGGTVTLKPGSFHIMFMKMQEQLKAGETRDVTLQFENAGEVSIPFQVKEIGRGKAAMDHSKHGNSN